MKKYWYITFGYCTYSAHVLLHATPLLIADTNTTVQPTIILDTLLWVTQGVLGNLQNNISF